MKRKLPGENFVNLGKPHEVVLFLEILEYAVPFATGRCRKFKPDLLVEWKASHNAPCLPPKFYITIVSPGYYSHPKRNRRQYLFKNLGCKQGALWSR